MATHSHSVGAGAAPNRRDFLIGTGQAGAGLFTATLLGSTSLAAPKRGGRLRLGMADGSTKDTFDTATVNSSVMMNINLQVRNCLIELGYDSEPIGELAESWEATPDASRWVFRLRKGVEFHNGKSLDADDVVFSINHHRGPQSKSLVKGIVNPITDIKADGKDIVVITLDGPNASFPYILADYHLTIVPADTTDFQKGVGTGGYVLQDFQPGVRALVRRNPNYWKQGHAHFDEVETINVTDVTARTNALLSGQIDAMSRCDLKSVHLLKRQSNIKILQTTGTKHYSLPMLTDTAPFDNNDVRLALKYAINRKDLLERILQGYGALGNDHPIAPANRFLATELPQREYDPDKAKFHLRKSGIGEHTFRLSAAEAAFSGALDAAVLVKEHAARAGINIEVVREPNDGYWSNVWLKKPWCITYWSGRPTEDWMFSIAYSSSASWNDTHWKNERFERMLVEARAELNDAKRRSLYVEMQRLVQDEGGAIIPVFAADVMGLSTKLQTPERLAPSWEMDNNRCAERWWFA